MRVTVILRLLCLILAMSQTHSQASNEKTGDEPRAQDSKATVYIYHSSPKPGGMLLGRLSGAQSSVPVYFDEIQLANLESESFFIAKLDTGKHIFRTNDQKSVVEIDLKSGQTYYLRFEYKMGFTKPSERLVLVNGERGEREIKDLKLKPLAARNIKDSSRVVVDNTLSGLLSPVDSQSPEKKPAAESGFIQPPTKSNGVISFEERLLATIPANYKEASIYGSSLAESWTRVVNNEFGETFWAYALSYQNQGGGWAITCGPGCAKVAYRAKQAGKEFIVVGDQRGPDFDQVQAPVFSPDGSRLAYVAKQGGKRFVVIGDMRGEQFDSVGTPVFSPDGKKVAYSACLNKKCFVVVGDQRGPEFQEVSSSPIFSPDSSKVAYVARETKKGNVFVVVGEKRGPENFGISELTFSPDSSQVAYAVLIGRNEWQMVVGDKVGPKFNIILRPVFSADGSNVAYAAVRENWHIVIGDQVGPQFSAVGAPVLKNDGRIAYLAVRNDSSLTRVSHKSLLVVGDKQAYIEFPGTSLRGAPYAITGTQTYLRVTASTLNPVTQAYSKSLTFSPDGSKFAYCIYSSFPKFAVVVGDQKGQDFDEVGLPVFSPDGNKVGYWARNKREIWWKVVEAR